MRRMVVAAAAVAVVLAGCTGGEQVADFGPGAPGDDAPDLPADAGLSVAEVPAPDTVPSADAHLEEVDWSAAAAWIRDRNADGQPVVINFFASFCEPCKRELPLLLDTAAAEEEIAFLGVHTNEQHQLGVEMVDEYDIVFPTFHDPAGDVVFAVGGRGLPHTVAFDVEGRLVSRVFGELTETNLSQLLDEVR